ncbi:uncharacterized protein LOC116260725 isoform X2 [Nymphaea colorata]|uniref:uncharacterized protein LOC116260725 isoform X2 n=1 Tax=Nymphaea colorata TaxID=210225 RepID=UPI00129E59CB|nr:uncharacterized protein LOC116260725 isoform X2 [Nymphaea colorata]
MEENGYRPPQFSEDTAWVPVWLQSCRVSSLSQQARGADSFPQPTNNVEWPPETLGDGQEPIREGAANNNFELFLSGDDICSVGNSLSKESVQPFQLHLSSDVSEHSLNQYYESYGASLSSRGTVHPKFTPGCLVVKNLEGPCDKLRNTDPMASSEAQVTNMQKYHTCPEPDNNNCEGRNFSIGFLENADVDSAIELSIVASEALAISDMVCTSLPSEACAASAVLEIALKVKEARIQACVSNADVSLISSEEVEEVDSLSDLDEEAMVDAFSDVGLSPIKGIVKTNSCCMQLNQAADLKVGACEHYSLLTKKMGKNVDNYQITAEKSRTCLAEECIQYPCSVATHVAGSCSVYVANEQHLEVQAADPVGTFSERNSAETASIRQHELLVITTSEVAKSITEHFKGSEELDFNTKSWGPIQFKECKAFGVETGETHSEKSMSMQPFKSRWLGGWTGREVDLDAESLEPFESETSIVTPPWVQDPGDHTAEVAKKAGSKGYSGSHQHDNCMDQVVKSSVLDGLHNKRRKSNFFVGETSFLSESVAALDENFAAYKPEGWVNAWRPEGNASCVSGMPVEAIDSNISIVNVASQAVANSYCSLDDPLCSVVKCSVPGENANSYEDVTSRLQDLELDKQNRLGPDSDSMVGREFFCSLAKLTGIESLESPVASVRCMHPRISSAGFGEIRRTLVASLKSYSMLTSFKKATFDEQKDSTSNKIIMSRDKSEKITQVLQSKINSGCCQPLNLEKKSQCADSSKSRGRHKRTANPVEINGCIHKQKKRENCCTVKKNILKNSDVMQTIDALDDGITMHQLDGRSCSPLVWKNGTRRRLRPCKTIGNDANEEYTMGGGAETCLGKIPFTMLEKKSSCRENAKRKTPPPQLESTSHEQGPLIKKVRFAEDEDGCEQRNFRSSGPTQIRSCLRQGNGKKWKNSFLLAKLKVQNKSQNCSRTQKRVICMGLEFMLTGFTRNEKQELEVLIREHGGVVLFDIPSPSPRQTGKRRPFQKDHAHTIILSPRKVRTTKVLYGCATNARLLKVEWLIDSISLGSMLPPDKYLLLPNQSAGMQNMGLGQSAYIFDGVGIMLYGKASFCIKFTKLIRHGGGRVFKTLQGLVQNLRNKKVNIGAIVVEDMGWATRHLKQCASEYKLNMMSANWITGSLLSRKVLPFDTNDMDLCSTIKEAGVEVIGSSQEM